MAGYRPVVDTVPTPAGTGSDRVAVQLGVAIPLLPSAEDKVVDDALGEGHEDLFIRTWLAKQS